MSTKTQPASWLTIALFIILSLLAMPGWLLPNNSPVSEMLFPGFIALYICLILPRRRANLATLGVNRLGHLRAYLPILLLLLASAASYVVPALLGLGKAGAVGTISHLIVFIPLAIYEEVGWRGWLQYQLTERIGIRKAVLLIGVIWALWHTGLIATGQLFDASGGTPALTIAFFVLSSLLISIVLGYTRFTSHSVWPAVIGHAGLNYVEEFGNAIFSHQSQAFSYVSGITSLVLLAGLAWYLWRKLPANGKQTSAQV